MDPRVIFQRLVQRDMDDVLRYYIEEAGEVVADRFFQTFLQVLEQALHHPERYHPVSPYLRHDRRHPSFGIRRK